MTAPGAGDWRELGLSAANQRREGRLTEALAALDELLQELPDDPTLRFCRAVVLVELGDIAAATQALAELPSDHPGRAPLEACLGESADQRQRRLERADELVRSAVAHRLTGALEQAFDEADAAVATDPGNPWAWELRGLLLAEGGRVDEAQRDLAQALALKPDLSRAAARLAELTARPAPSAPEPPPTPRRDGWGRVAWRLTRGDLPAWFLYDSLAATIILLPPSLLLVVPLAALVARSLDLAREAVVTGWPGLLALGLVGLVAGWLWAVGAAGWVLVPRLAVTAVKVRTGQFRGRLLLPALRGLGGAWWQGALALALLTGLPWLLLVAPGLPLALPLALLGGRDAFLACSEAWRRTRWQWAAWLWFAVSSLTGPLVLGGLSVAAPVALVVHFQQTPATVLIGVLGVSLLLHVVMILTAWLTACLALTAWLVAYTEQFPDDGLRGLEASVPVVWGTAEGGV